MSTRHTHRWLAWLLPLVLLRACVPVGFMLAWSEQGLQVVLCSGMGPLAARHASHHAANQHEHAGAHEASPCPFAVAQLGGALPALSAAVALILPSSQPCERLAAREVVTDSLHLDRIRGPPLA